MQGIQMRQLHVFVVRLAIQLLHTQEIATQSYRAARRERMDIKINLFIFINMQIIGFIREFITNIYKFAMHVLDFFEPPSSEGEIMKLEYSASAGASKKDDMDMDLDVILDNVLNDLSGDDISPPELQRYTPLYFDNLSYSDFLNYKPPAHNFFGGCGETNYMNDLFFATTNDCALDINRPFFDENLQTQRRVIENDDGHSDKTDDDMPDLVSISSESDHENVSITPLVMPQDDADDFACLEFENIS